MNKFSCLFFILLLALAACGKNEDIHNSVDKEDEQKEQTIVESRETGEGNEQVEENEEVPPTLLELEETKKVEIEMEGVKEEKVVHLQQHEKLGFSTYVPEDMMAESDDQTFNVYTNFGGNLNKDARFFITKQGEQEIVEYLKNEGFAISSVEEQAFNFSQKEYQLEKEGFIGRLSIFNQNEESYSLAYYYPSEYADGFSARSHIIVQEMVWH